jgi:hypothetical protein
MKKDRNTPIVIDISLFEGNVNSVCLCGRFLKSTLSSIASSDSKFDKHKNLRGKSGLSYIGLHHKDNLS